MISKKCFTKSWIDSLRTRYQGADPILLEKNIVAFELLGLLAQSGAPFIFKGGTAVMLHLPEPQRLSIDVDVIGIFSLDNLHRVITKSIFTSVEEDIRKSNYPKKHFKFYYKTNYPQPNPFVLLDVLEVENPYPSLTKKPIRVDLFEVEREIKVTIPTVEGLLGDKLTAFAPETIGVSYGSGKSMEIIKQVFDIGELFDLAVDFDGIRKAYLKTHEIESVFQKNRYSIHRVLDDTIRTAYMLNQIDLKNSMENEKTRELRLGIQKIRNHLLNRQFSFPEAKIAASWAALIAALIKKGETGISLRQLHNEIKSKSHIKGITITGKYETLNRLKVMLPEAFFCWHRISLLDESEGKN